MPVGVKVGLGDLAMATDHAERVVAWYTVYRLKRLGAVGRACSIVDLVELANQQLHALWHDLLVELGIQESPSGRLEFMSWSVARSGELGEEVVAPDLHHYSPLVLEIKEVMAVTLEVPLEAGVASLSSRRRDMTKVTMA
jgi:hypothetical protein